MSPVLQIRASPSPRLPGLAWGCGRPGQRGRDAKRSPSLPPLFFPLRPLCLSVLHSCGSRWERTRTQHLGDDVPSPLFYGPFPDRGSPKGSFPDWCEGRRSGGRPSWGAPSGPQLFLPPAGAGVPASGARGWGRWSARLGLLACCRPRLVPCPWRLLGAIPVSLIEARCKVWSRTRGSPRREGRGREPGAGRGTN